ncbi:hypothetical protein DGo_PE0028 (plasmid) [Deinococcus gobiensis I-0]|uniref:Uncharacterized protein n=1 Tax=Deinococcus gobiensis (strain DSM 21396 / JCM 16679 / CGMCC 1.7299 / I-0) TaxID=745776 RepID=H8H3S5_DEIGI|nr:hypothetical protein DGo_PE0028 [Deinococcus gobiensis I-0]
MVAAPVHPHACGEHGIATLSAGGMTGPSPRLWGTRRAARVAAGLPRSIPTPVGNTRPTCADPPGRTVHPHACGEHAQELLVQAVRNGPSPRLWGTQMIEMWNDPTQRSIPTPVGNTPERRSGQPQWPVHPHACGEHTLADHMIGSLAGPSPRLWGTPGRL